MDFACTMPLAQLKTMRHDAFMGKKANGHRGGAIGFGYVEYEAGVTTNFVKTGNFEIQVAGTCHPAQASLRSMYDPKNLRVRA
ncbi:MAG: hypothetical protein QF653_00670 [Acidimicrobiales bacterium]|nr:hypothetical protein [Acidimicrobiales bacterium]